MNDRVELLPDDGSGVVSEWRCVGCGRKLEFFDPLKCACGNYGDSRVDSGTWCPLGCMMVMEV